jgi:hypothetical protein
LRELIAAAQGYSGHLGVNVFRPTDRAHSEYRIVFKFAHLSNLKAWENSPLRQRLLERANRLTWQSPPSVKVLTGLETWFTLPAQPGMSPPPRYKMAIITCVALLPLSNLMNALLQPVLQFLPTQVRSLAIMAASVLMMTYVVMPRITKLFAGWLYPTAEG